MKTAWMEGKTAHAMDVRGKVEVYLNSAKKGFRNKFKRLTAEFADSEGISVEQVLKEVKEGNGRTALHFACAEGHLSIVQFIVECTGEELIEIRDELGMTPVFLAFIGGHENVLEYLLEKGAVLDTVDKSGATVFHHAAGKGMLEMLRKYLPQYRKWMDHVSETGTLLHWACGGNAVETVHFLLEHGADPNVLTEKSVSPLLIAVISEFDAVFDALMDRNCNCSLRLFDGLNVLHIAADSGLKSRVERILCSESGKTAALRRGDRGLLPIEMAAESGHFDVVDLLIEHSNVSESKTDLLERMKITESDTFSYGNTKDVTEEQKEEAEQFKLKGNECFKRKVYEKAIEWYSKAIQLDGTQYIYWSNRSASYIGIKEYHKALEDAERCIQLNPTWPKSFYRAAVALSLLGSYEDAAINAWEGYRLDPSNCELRHLLQSCVRKGKEEFALHQ